MDFSQDLKTIVELFNECRLEWDVFYPPINIEQLHNATLANFKKFVCITDDNTGCMLGHIDDCFSNNRIHIAYNDLIMVSTKRCVSDFHALASLDVLLNAFEVWARENNATRIHWTMHTGKWQTVQKLLAHRYKAKQTGISLVTEL